MLLLPAYAAAVEILTRFRDAMLARPVSANARPWYGWKAALQSWTCPTPPADSNGSCDPCGSGSWGNWDHM